MKDVSVYASFRATATMSKALVNYKKHYYNYCCVALSLFSFKTVCKIVEDSPTAQLQILGLEQIHLKKLKIFSCCKALAGGYVKRIKFSSGSVHQIRMSAQKLCHQEFCSH